ncbi:PREDICTED: uncharacterized protein LOC108560971 [Nicrophorus vespilloides]|uniref:Uncharacterized protein LOC108560971 n=1 Tax=Nicrophorus vespilloides TaxID=110193 RepID=A0ABM1MI01_NICVS|nr:PREDICTED: uncharacterized protein LOC108560971 [Nicrophorus vespilloides]
MKGVGGIGGALKGFFFGKKYDFPEKFDKNEKTDFETAITATGFGKFNLWLILVAIPSGWASLFETTTISYLIPVAHCDLDISLEERGYLISISYLGEETFNPANKHI